MDFRKLAAVLLIATPSLAAAADWETTLVPETDLYPGYIADPRRAVFRFGIAGYADSEIPEAGDLRLGVTLGGLLADRMRRRSPGGAGVY